MNGRSFRLCLLLFEVVIVEARVTANRERDINFRILRYRRLFFRLSVSYIVFFMKSIRPSMNNTLTGALDHETDRKYFSSVIVMNVLFV